MQNPLDFASLPGPRSGRSESYAGAMGVFALIAALFTKSNASGSMRIVVYGLLLEMARRGFQWLYTRVLIQPKVSATFTQGDPAYEWIMLYLTEEGVWKKSKDFDVTAKSTKRKFTVAPSFEELGIKSSADLVPKWITPHLFRWNGYWVDVVRSGDGSTPTQWSGNQPAATLKLQFFTLHPVVIARFVEDAKQRYEETNRPRVTIHLSDNPMGRNVWGNTKSKIRRPINTVALPSGVMESILEDVKEFNEIEDWYIQAGIPHHRGYLLYGPPGTGKTSTIYAIAGELGLEIYALSLSASHIDDAYLHRLAAAVPRGSILLIEDIDCAFPSRDADAEEDENGPPQAPMEMVMQATATGGRRMMVPASTGRVTMSGLLNLMDGVGSDDGRIIFATTNYYDRLDPALVRPGRIDFKVEYKRATSAQAAALFDRFFPPERFSDSPLATPAGLSAADRHMRSTPLSRPLLELGKAFSSSVPEDEFSAAELQGYLLTCKWDPERAVDGLSAWVDAQRRERAERVVREEKEREKRKAKKSAIGGSIDRASVTGTRPTLPKE